MKKEFIEKVLRDGVYETKAYRYEVVGEPESIFRWKINETGKYSIKDGTLVYGTGRF